MKTGSKEWRECIRNGIQQFGISIDDRRVDQFAVYIHELERWNARINLTAITDPHAIAVKHIIDSVIPVQDIPPESSLIDIGSGGGFPGIPLKIMMPSLSVTLIDASRKKVNFLKQVKRLLNLDATCIIHARAQDIAGDQNYRQSYDIAISRAFSHLEEFVTLAAPFLKPGGAIIAMKGREVQSEINSLLTTIGLPGIHEKAAGHNMSIVHKTYSLPFIKADRGLVILKSHDNISS